jgi:transmembrane sensor
MRQASSYYMLFYMLKTNKLDLVKKNKKIFLQNSDRKREAARSFNKENLPMSSRISANKSLLQKYLDGEPLTESEQSEFDAWKARLKHHPDLEEQLKDQARVEKELEEESRFPVQEVWAMVLERIEKGEKPIGQEEETIMIVAEEQPAEQEEQLIGQEEKPMRAGFPRLVLVTAACVLTAVGGIYLFINRAARPVSAPVTSVVEKGPAKGIPKLIVNDKVPDKRQDQTVLTLSDQRRIVPDNVASDEPLATANHTTVSFGAGNQLTYRSMERPQPGEDVAYNVFETGQHIAFPYVIKLSEGSTISVNAGSKVRYPVAFSGKGVRKVEVWGEAYFEVSPQADAPFEVTVDGATIEVLGTAFNVKAFAHKCEGRITLIKGQVRVTSQKNPGKSYLLNPWEQVRISKDEDLQKQIVTDTSSIVEWKKRQFRFDGKSFDQVLREVAQWYRLKLPDMTTISGQPIGGILNRDLPVATILQTIQTLEDNKIRFSLKGDSLQIRQSP